MAEYKAVGIHPNKASFTKDTVVGDVKTASDALVEKGVQLAKLLDSVSSKKGKTESDKEKMKDLTSRITQIRQDISVVETFEK